MIAPVAIDPTAFQNRTDRIYSVFRSGAVVLSGAAVLSNLQVDC